MFKKVSKQDWMEREDLRLRVARFRVPTRERHDHPGSMIQLRVPIGHRRAGSRGRLTAARGLLTRLLNFVRGKRT